MADMMTFPETVEEFMEQYKITDTEHIYSNGMELVPIFRMKQWFAHKSERKTGRWIWNPNSMDWNLGAWCCSECKLKAETWWANDEKYNPLMCSGGHFCGNCGAKMEGEKNETDQGTDVL